MCGAICKAASYYKYGSFVCLFRPQISQIFTDSLVVKETNVRSINRGDSVIA